jgi:hypothetical protein
MMNLSLDLLTLLTTMLCAILLLRAYRNVRRRLLLWSGLCFVGMSLSTMLRIADLRIFLQTDLYSYRLSVTAVSMALLLFGLIWESQ